jgi:hypothetical protein
MMTQGVSTTPGGFAMKALMAVQAFDRFDRNNDPHREHDVVSVEIEGHVRDYSLQRNAAPLTSNEHGKSANNAKTANRAPHKSRHKELVLCSDFQPSGVNRVHLPEPQVKIENRGDGGTAGDKLLSGSSRQPIIIHHGAVRMRGPYLHRSWKTQM